MIVLRYFRDTNFNNSTSQIHEEDITIFNILIIIFRLLSNMYSDYLKIKHTKVGKYPDLKHSVKSKPKSSEKVKIICKIFEILFKFMNFTKVYKVNLHIKVYDAKRFPELLLQSGCYELRKFILILLQSHD